MFSLGHHHHYLLYGPPCDMRKGFDGLCGLVTNALGRSPLDGSVYIFVNRRCDQLKLLVWEPGGLVLYHKRLEKGRFSVPDTSQGNRVIKWPELVLIAEGIQVSSVRKKVRFQGIKA